MSLDRPETVNYTVSNTGHKPGEVVPDRCDRDNEKGDAMIVFLSFPGRDAVYRKVVDTLRMRGLTVLTNLDRSGLEGAENKTDLRLARIRRSDAFVFFAPDIPKDQWSPLRQVEFGYALGCELPVAFVGKPFNSLHRYGDVFDSVDDFLERWYSEKYLDDLEEWLPHWTSATEVA